MTQYYTIKETAEILKTTENTIRVKVRNGVIPKHPWDGDIRIPKEFIDRWDVSTKESFIEQRYKALLDQAERDNQELKNKIRKIMQISLEVEIK